MPHTILFLVLSVIAADQAPPPSVVLRTDSVKVKSVSFDPPEKIESRGGFAIYTPGPDVKAVEYIALDGEEPFPVSLVGGSPTAFVFFTRGLPAKNYRFVGVASDAGGNLTRKQFSVPVGNVPAPKDPPGTTPPGTTPADTYYFLLVRPDGPATSAFTKIRSDPAWKELQKAGHRVGDMGVTDAAQLGIQPPDILPCVITLLESGKKSKIVRPAIALPSTPQAILDLPKGVK